MLKKIKVGSVSFGIDVDERNMLSKLTGDVKIYKNIDRKEITKI